MGQTPYMRSVIDRNVVMRPMTVLLLQFSTSGQIAVRKCENDSRGNVEVGRRKRKLVTQPRQSYRETTLPRAKLCGKADSESRHVVFSLMTYHPKGWSYAKSYLKDKLPTEQLWHSRFRL